MAKSKNYDDWLIERLKDPDEAIAYLNSALEESLKEDEESQQIFMMALKRLASLEI